MIHCVWSNHMVKDTTSQIKTAILHKSLTAFLIIDKEGIIHYASPSCFNFKLNPKSIVNTSFFDLVTKKHKKKVRDHISSVINDSSSSVTFTFKSNGTDAHQFFEATLQNLVGDSDINGILVSLRDRTETPEMNRIEKEITLRKRFESELKQNREKYQLLVTQANEGICVAQDGLLKFVNPKLCQMLKSSEKELLFKPFTQFIHPDDRNLVTERYRDRLKGKKVPEEYNFRAIDSQGHTHWVQIHAAQFLWNEKPATVNFLSEVSDRIYTEKKYQRLLDIAPLLTVELDVETFNVISVNKSLCKSVGLSSDQIIGKHAKNLLPSRVFEERYQVAKKAINEDTIIKITDERNGRHFINTYIPLKTPEGERRLFVIAQDITDLRLVEQKYQRLIDSSPDAIAEVDGKTHKIITVNPAMAKNFDMSKDELIGKDWKSILPPDVYESRFELGLKTVERNEIQFFEDQRNDRYFQNLFVPLKISDNQTNLQIISRDISKFRKTQQKLKENEEKFRTITTSAQDAIIIVNEQGEITFWNKSAERIFDYKESEILGRNVHQLLMPEKYNDSQMTKVFKGFRKTGTGSVIGKTQELLVRKKNGKRFPVELSLSSIKLQNRWHAVGIVRDISERKKMENELLRSKETLEKRVQQRTQKLEDALKKLSESEKRYRSLIQTAPVGIAVVDQEGQILDLNDIARKMTGYKKGEIDFSRYYANKKDQKEIASALNKQGYVRNWESEFVKIDGEHFYGLLNIEKISFEGKSAFLVIQQDISPLKKAEQQLREFYEYLKNVINSTTEFIFTMDYDKKITMWNKTAESKIGKSSSKVIGKKVTQLSFIKNPQVLLDNIKNISTGYNPGNTEIIVNTKKGTNLIFRISVSKIKGVNDESSGYVVVGQDVTSEKQLNEKIVEGLSYLQYKTNLDEHESLIVDLKSQSRPMLLITRGSTSIILQKTKQMDMNIIYLDDGQDDNHISSCDELFSNISDYISSHEHAVVLIDRLDFLIMKTSFETVLRMIYQLTSLVDAAKAVCIIQINPKMFSVKQLNLLKEELTLFQGAEVEDVTLEESLYQILRFIYQQNQRNVVVSYSKVGKRFNISKVTTGKRISELEQKGLVTIRLKGRIKSILVTKKAEDLIEKRTKSEF